MLKRLTRKLVILSVLAAASLAALAPGGAKASSQSYGYEYFYFYYSDATYSQYVGMCQGDTCTNSQYCDGVRTEFYTTSTNIIACY